MSDLRSRIESNLPHLLLVITVAELAIYRLLVPALRPRADLKPPMWHSAMTYLGLFLFYFASALAIGVVAHQLQQMHQRRQGKIAPLTHMLVLSGACFLVLATLSVAAVPSSAITFMLEGFFVLTVALIMAKQLVHDGDVGARIGLVLLALPLIVHFYAPLSVRYIGGDEALWNGLTDQVENTGRWLVLIAALTMPYCFGARPFFLRAARIPPVMAALAVGLMGATVVRHDYVKGMELAQNGFGFAVGIRATGSFIALCLLALSAVTWTLVNCLSATSPSRQRIGVGVALVVAGGYAFAWPLQYLVGVAGLLAIVRGTKTVRDEERRDAGAPGVPPIDDVQWQQYMTSILETLRGETETLDEAGTEDGAGSVVTIRGESGQSRTHFVCKRKSMDVTVTVERVSGSIIGLDVRCGDGEVDGEPVWSLHSKQPSPVGLVHPMPPSCSGKVYRGGDETFRKRFDVLDAVGWSERLLAAPLAERLESDINGWVAIWDNGTLRFQVYPGRGAPMNTPIPITALSFQSGEKSPEPMIVLLDLLAGLAARAHLLAEDAGEDPES